MELRRVKRRDKPRKKIRGEKMVKQNLGNLDRILRFGLAFWWLSPLAPQFSLNGAYLTLWFNLMTGVNTLVPIIGWIALIESFLGWCWLHQLLHIQNK